MVSVVVAPVCVPYITVQGINSPLPYLHIFSLFFSLSFFRITYLIFTYTYEQNTLFYLSSTTPFNLHRIYPRSKCCV